MGRLNRRRPREIASKFNLHLDPACNRKIQHPLLNTQLRCIFGEPFASSEIFVINDVLSEFTGEIWDLQHPTVPGASK
jgi:hypothetical protein